MFHFVGFTIVSKLGVKGNTEKLKKISDLFFIFQLLMVPKFSSLSLLYGKFVGPFITQFSSRNFAYFFVVWSEKHDFCDTQQKILQISDFAKKQDSIPLPHGDVAACIAEMIIRLDFQEIPLALSQKSDSAKNFFQIFAIFPLS
jgi:hypothetical protein